MMVKRIHDRCSVRGDLFMELDRDESTRNAIRILVIVKVSSNPSRRSMPSVDHKI
jgi:hypothetical protein